MSRNKKYQVKDVARMARVSVRALHHYDQIGLLKPSARTDSSYRLYSDDDLLRLQQILIGRELGMSLEQIKRSLDDPGFDRRAALERQREELAARAQRTAAMLRAVDAALAAIRKDGGEDMKDMSKEEMEALFDGFDHSKYEEEVKERWGDTEAYAQSAKRTSKYTKADWERYKAESDEIMSEAAQLLRAGVKAESAQAMDVAERHRLSIDRWFYRCDKQMHVQLADMYEADARFAENIDKDAPGLTKWLSAAIRANAGR